MFTNSVFPQTELQDAYQFNTFSQYIINNGLLPKFSPNCIFCSSNDTRVLLTEAIRAMLLRSHCYCAPPRPSYSRQYQQQSKR